MAEVRLGGGDGRGRCPSRGRPGRGPEPPSRSAVLSAQRFAGNPLCRTAASEWHGRAEFESARFFSSSAETRCPPRGGDSTNIRRETSGTGGAWPLPALPQVTRGGTLLRGMNWAGGGRILRGISVARGGEAAHAAHGHEGAGSGFQLWIGSASGDEDRGFDSN